MFNRTPYKGDAFVFVFYLFSDCFENSRLKMENCQINKSEINRKVFFFF